MGDFDMVGQRGTTIGYRLPVAIGDVPVDLTLPNTVVVFTAKRRRGDAIALIEKTYHAVPGTPDAGFGLLASTTDTLDLEVAPAETAPDETTGFFVFSEFLVWDAILTEPNGRETAIGRGSFTIRAGVGT